MSPTEQLDNIMQLCKVSMCPPEVNTDTSYLDENATCFNGDSTHFVVEFGSTQTEILATPGQHISVDDPIAYMRGIVVKSQLNGTITSKTDRYIIGDYDIDSSAYNINLDESNLNTKTDFDEVNDILKENQYVTSFIKGYILRFRFADIATHSAVFGVKDTEDIVEDYIDDANDINEDYENDIKRICKKSNVQTYCENDNLLGLKTQIDNARITAFNRIINQYRNIASYGYTKGKISDYMLYDMYMEYIISEDFVYDDDNPYVVELFYNINNFLKVRSKLELNGSNIEGLISNFNTLCNQTIGIYWNSHNKNYYTTIKQIFQYDFFTDDDNDLIQAVMNDENRVTLYSKVLDYLKNLTHYQAPTSAEEKYKNMDTQTLINMGEIEDSSSEKANKELLDKLKKISLYFVNLRKIEVDSDSPDYYEMYISQEDLEQTFIIKNTLESLFVDIGDYSSITTDPELLSYSEPLKKYLGALRDLTNNEAMILKELSDRAVNWYIQNYQKIDSGSIFDRFRQVEWPSPTTIQKDGIPHDFFYIEEPKTNDEQIESDSSIGNFPEDYVKTKYGINSYMYWLRYCTIATLVNCMLPMYWSTGVLSPTGPIPLPIIFVPIVVIPGRVITVIGLGICGICPLPMIYFVNVGDMPACIIPPINLAVDMLKKVSGLVISAGMIPIKETVLGLIKANDEAINKINEQIEQIDKDCYNLSVGVKNDMETMRALRKKKNLDPTTNKRKNET